MSTNRAFWRKVDTLREHIDGPEKAAEHRREVREAAKVRNAATERARRIEDAGATTPQ